MAIHANISASALPRIFECPASFKMSMGMPNKPNPAALRGTAIHLVAEQLFNGDPINPPAPDQEGLQIAKDYVAYINGIDGEKHIEIDLAPALQTVHPDCGGHADCIIINDTELHCIDLKTGAGKVTPDSIQLKMYLLGSWIHFGRPNLRLFAHIVQPFNHSIPVEYTVQDILDFEEKLLAIIEQATDPFVQPTPTYTACKYCNGKTVCPSIKGLAVKTAKLDFNSQANMFDLPELLDTAEVLEGWINAVRESAKDLLSTGAFIAGWELSKGRKMSKIRNETEVIAHFEGNQRLYTLKSLTQLKKDGFEIPEKFIEESLSASSLKRSK